MIALLTKHNSYIGREYAAALIESGINFSVIAFGDEPELDEMEEERCGGHWKPMKMKEIAKFVEIERFHLLGDRKFLNYLKTRENDLAIQGDVGAIIKEKLIQQFSQGIVNFHPGDLPAYRGCMALEWQILEHKPVVCTAHFVDKGIDTGPIIAKQELSVSYKSYHWARASLYPEVAKFVTNFVKNYSKGQYLTAVDQDSGIYREPMREADLNVVKALIKSRGS